MRRPSPWNRSWKLPSFTTLAVCSGQFLLCATSRWSFYFPWGICPSRGMKLYGTETRLLSLKCLNSFLAYMDEERRKVELVVALFPTNSFFCSGNKQRALRFDVTFICFVMRYRFLFCCTEMFLVHPLFNFTVKIVTITLRYIKELFYKSK